MKFDPAVDLPLLDVALRLVNPTQFSLASPAGTGLKPLPPRLNSRRLFYHDD
ncbi:MAG TPA: hypothetical protein VMC82_01320 [Thermoplasmata archaeon]|nr:hypothetical protein [Thermoplasmata archaeon]